MKTINIKEYTIRREIPPELQASDWCAIDLEINNMEKSKMHRPTGTLACATFYSGGEDVYIVEDIRDLPQALENVSKAKWAFHNAKFDIFHLRRYVNVPINMRVWDTQLVEQIRYSGKYGDFSLADLARRYLDLYMEKETREEFSSNYGEMTQSQIEYACIDTIVTYQVLIAQRTSIDAYDLKIWKEQELPFLWTLLSIKGIKLDQEEWLRIARDNGSKAAAIQNKYGKKVPKIGAKGQPLKSFVFEGINLASPKQVKERLWSMNFKVAKTDEETLSPLVDRCEFAKDLLDFRNLSKRSGTYGEDYIEKFVEADGKIYTDYFQMGALSGRMSSRSPNLQNQPRDGGYRECYVAEDGNVIVVADWASQEPKFAAHITGDENLIDALNSKEKLYIRVARDALGIEVKKGEPAYNHMKSTILGLFYGMSAKGLSERIGVQEEEAKEMIAAILRAYPKVGQWITASRQNFVPYVTSVSGRKIWLNEYTNAWRRAALNYPIQSSAAEAMKIASWRIVRDWDGECPIRLFVHDEVVCEVTAERSEEFKAFLEKVMIDAAEELHPSVHAGVEIGVGSSWAAKQ